MCVCTAVCIYIINQYPHIDFSATPHQSSIIFVIFIPKWKSGEQAEQVDSSLIVCTIQFSDAHSLIFPSQIKHWFLGPLSKAVQLKGPHPYDAKLLGTIWFKNSGRCNVGSSPNITNLRIDWVLQYFYEFQDRNIACVYDMACNLILTMTSTIVVCQIQKSTRQNTTLTESWPLQCNRGRKPSYTEGGSNR